MDTAELCGRLEAGEIVALPRREWDEVEPGFALLEQQDTFQSGFISVRHGACGVVVVEEPGREERVVRRLADLGAARAFVGERLATYDRMWNGCGCRIDYYR